MIIVFDMVLPPRF